MRKSDKYLSVNSDVDFSQKPSSVFWSLLFCILIPVIILNKLSGDSYLGVKLGIIIALAFPIFYGLKEFYTTSKVDLFSVLGVISVPLTGGISLLELDATYIAIKEAAIPGILGLAILISLRTSQPFLHTLLKSQAIFKGTISQIIIKNNCQDELDTLLSRATWILACSFFLSSALNFILAVVVLTGTPGTELFNQQLGKMLALSFPVNALPAMLVMIANLVYVSRGIRQLTGLTLEEIINISEEGK